MVGRNQSFGFVWLLHGSRSDKLVTVTKYNMDVSNVLLQVTSLWCSSQRSGVSSWSKESIDKRGGVTNGLFDNYLWGWGSLGVSGVFPVDSGSRLNFGKPIEGYRLLVITIDKGCY